MTSYKKYFLIANLDILPVVYEKQALYRMPEQYVEHLTKCAEKLPYLHCITIIKVIIYFSLCFS